MRYSFRRYAQYNSILTFTTDLGKKTCNHCAVKISYTPETTFSGMPCKALSTTILSYDESLAA